MRSKKKPVAEKQFTVILEAVIIALLGTDMSMILSAYITMRIYKLVFNLHLQFTKYKYCLKDNKKRKQPCYRYPFGVSICKWGGQKPTTKILCLRLSQGFDDCSTGWD